MSERDRKRGKICFADGHKEKCAYPFLGMLHTEKNGWASYIKKRYILAWRSNESNVGADGPTVCTKKTQNTEHRTQTTDAKAIASSQIECSAHTQNLGNRFYNTVPYATFPNH